MITDSAITRTPGVLEAEVDGERVLMHPSDFAYFGLSESGSAVWELIDGARSVVDIAAVLAQEYDADPETITHDVAEFVAALEAGRLITLAR
jgi:hypothetical protein